MIDGGGVATRVSGRQAGVFAVSRFAGGRERSTGGQRGRLSPGGRGRVDPGPALLRFPIRHAYLCQDADGLTLIDASMPGSAPVIAAEIRTAGHHPADLRHLVLTHFHSDPAGSAAEIAASGNVEVCAHYADALLLCSQAPRTAQAWSTGSGPSSARSADSY